MAAQQCRESERFHGIICCYIGFAFFSPCKFQTGNPSRRCALQGSLWAGLAACCHAFLARSPDKFGLSRCFPKSGTAEDAIQLSREEVYLLSITMDSVEVWEWDGKNINIFVVSKCGSGSRKCLLLNWLNDFALNEICGWFASLNGNTHTASNCWPCRFCNAVENRTGLCSSGRVEHNPILPDCKGTICCDWFRIMHVK